MDNGLIKSITEQYLVDSMSFTEAEGRVMTEAGEGMREVTVVSIKRSAIKETVMYGDTDLFFKVKVSYELMDEETEKSKKVNTYLLVNANDAKEAYERTEEHLKEMLVPFSIVSIAESPIIEVYQYQKGLRPGLRRMAKDIASAQFTDGEGNGDGVVEKMSGEFDMDGEDAGDMEESARGINPVETDYPVWLIDQLAQIFGGEKTVGQLSNIVNQYDLREPFDFEVWLEDEHSPTERQSKDCFKVLNQPRE